MSNKKHNLIVIFQIILALVLAIGASSFFGPCRGMEGKVPPCKSASQTITYLGACIAILGAVALYLRNWKARIALSVVSLALSVVALLTPGTLHKLCMMETMRCNTVMKPATMILSAVLALLAVAELIRSIQEGRKVKQS